ncbi:MAG TPA: hypothetical protein VFP96_13595, partial [Candidatus Acidoferrum sp.]|nr:hypothetical protein [Candidatus Acidoferrum sp.]
MRIAWHVLPCSAVIERLVASLFAANLALTSLQPPAHFAAPGCDPRGPGVLLQYGLMVREPVGHGAYLGSDYSAEYLHRLSEITRDMIASAKYGKLFAQLSADEQSAAAAQTSAVLKENRSEPASQTLWFSPGEVAAYRTQLPEWSGYFTRKDAAPGLPANYIQDRGQRKSLTAHFAWAAWAATANRSGKDYSCTNNWPYEPT